MQTIRIRGARTHNLRNVDLELPRDRFIVFTGLSGSGKSSLAFDTLYAEGQRRYVESLSAYARQFLAMMEKPDVDSIEGLSPAIAIEQKSTSHNPRSTVGTVTEVYDYLRLLYARAGTARCPDHGQELSAQTVSQMVDQVLKLPEGTALLLLAPLVTERKGEHAEVLEQLRGMGYVRARIDGRVVELDQAPKLDRKRKHTIEAVVDRFKVRADGAQRLAESFEMALSVGDGVAKVAALSGESATEELTFSDRMACSICGFSLPELEPRLFSFNNPIGACPACDGLGVKQFFDAQKVVAHPHLSLAGGAVRGWDRRNTYYYQLIQSLAKHYGFDVDTPWAELPERVRAVILGGSGGEPVEFRYFDARGKLAGKRRHAFEGVLPNLERRYRETESPAVREELAKYLSVRPCPECGGARLNRAARNVFIADHSLPQIAGMSVGAALQFLAQLALEGWRGTVATRIVKEITDRLRFLVDVGLEYLTLARSAETLSGGEAQRIRLASQVGSGLVGVTYILDEPSIGLHQRDNRRLLDTLVRLRDLGNTVIVVEHDEDAIRAADYIVDLGPGAGIHGGRIVAQGTPRDLESSPESITGQYLSGKQGIAVPKFRRPGDGRQLCVIQATGNNLKAVDACFPIGLMTCVTGLSGSGKSTLVNDTLYLQVAGRLNDASYDAAPCAAIEGLEHIDRVIDIDQSPIGRTPRSNPATYAGLFTPIRELFAAVPEARARGYAPGRFSFNVKGGRCEACQGDGVIKVEMHFLPDIYVTCDVCKGRRYNRETLEIRYRGKSIYEVLEMTVEDALAFFRNVPMVAAKLETLMDVGLAYLKIGQNATTLSGGEAQRVKLAKELSKRATGRTLYILDEPTTGLHFHDVAQLLRVLEKLRDEGNTIVVIEHNLEVIKTADWVIDLGPEGGDGGGRIVAVGTPEEIAANPKSHTGQFLKTVLHMRRGTALIDKTARERTATSSK